MKAAEDIIVLGHVVLGYRLDGYPCDFFEIKRAENHTKRKESNTACANWSGEPLISLQTQRNVHCDICYVVHMYCRVEIRRGKVRLRTMRHQLGHLGKAIWTYCHDPRGRARV